MKQHNLLIICLFLFFVQNVRAQDLMYLRNAKQPIKVKVYEIGLDEIKYRPWGDTLIPILVLPRVNVQKLVLASGSVFEFSENPIADPVNYANQHNQAVKINFMSPLFSNTAFTYEKSIKPGRSYELGLAIIGLGIPSTHENLRGMYLRAGYKLISTPDYYVRGMKYAHLLKGGYVKPEIIFGAYGYDGEAYQRSYNYTTNQYSSSTISYRSNVTFGAMMVNFGKQWVYDDAMLFDLYFGLGYGFSAISNNKTLPRGYYNDESSGYHYAFVGGENSFPIAFALGLKLGFLFGKQPEAPQKAK